MSGWFLLASAFVQYQRKIKLLKKKLKKVRRLSPSVETFIHAENFIQCGGFYPARRLSSSAEIFIQYGVVYPV